MKSVIKIILTALLLALITVTPVMATVASAQGIVAVADVSSDATDQIPSPAPYVSPAPGVSPNADGTTAFALDELGITLNIPDYLYVITRNITPDNTNPAVFDLTSQDFINYFQIHDIYLNAISSQVSYEINVVMKQTPEIQEIYDFNELSPDELKAFIDNSVPIYQMSEFQYGESEIYAENPDAVFLKNDVFSDNINMNDTYGVQFFTIHDGKAITIYLTTYSTEKVEERMKMMTGVIDSATFEINTVPAPQQSPGSEASDNAQPSSESQPTTSALPSGGTQPSSGTQPSAGVQPSTDVTPSPNPGLISGLLALIGEPDYLLYAILLAATFIVVALPMLIYRFAIRKSPLSRGRAVLVTILYGVVIAAVGAAYIIFFKGNVVVEAGVVLWSVVNYFILTSREREKKEQDTDGLYPIILAEQAEKKQTVTNMTVNKTCKNCFAVNLATSTVCFYCGAKLDDGEDEDVKIRG